MNVAVLEMTDMNEGEYFARISFGSNSPTSGNGYDGTFKVVDNTDPDNIKVTISVKNETVGADEAAWAYFSEFMDDMEEGDTMINFPKPNITMHFNKERKGGTYDSSYDLYGFGDDPTTDEVEKDGHQFKIEFGPLSGDFRQIQ